MMKGEVYTQSNWLVLKVAELFFIKGKTQKEISDILQISNATTSRLLRRAKEEGIVQINIDKESMDCLRVSESLITKYDLQDVIVVSEPEGKDSESYETKRKVAHESARYLQRVICEEDILGIAWGRTIDCFIEYLNPCQKIDASFVTLHGNVVKCERSFDVNVLVSRIAMAFGGKHYSLFSHGLLSNKKLVDLVLKDGSVANIFDMFNRVTISISGLGVFYPVVSSPLTGSDFITAEELEQLKAKGVCADLLLRYIDQDGKECDTPLKNRTLAIDFATYKKIPKKIIIASGKHKAYAVRAVLRNQLADVLVMDYDLAKAVLDIGDSE